MEIIQIKEKSINTILYFDYHRYYGYTFFHNSIKNANNQILSIFKMFTLSKDNIRLDNYQEYQVYLDKTTGLKHYFNNNTENIYLLFINNGLDAISYLGKDSFNLNKTKIFNLKNKIIICTFLGLSLAISTPLNNYLNDFIGTRINLLIDDYKPLDIKKMLDSSIYLSSKEKEYLYNEKFITDVLEIVNNSYYVKNKWLTYFSNIRIIDYHDDNQLSGYYTIDTPNAIYIKNYSKMNESNKNVLTHEFIHLCQDSTGYNLIIEASAEIIAYEYFSDNYKINYNSQVKLIKKLMEIIGSESIWYYNFTGDFSKIEEKVKPYLTKADYQTFLNDLTFDYYDKLANLTKYESLDELLGKLYYNIYGKDISSNKIISLIDKDDKALIRYYFNQEKTSYYLDYNQAIVKNISYQEAIDKDYINAYTLSTQALNKEEALILIEMGGCNFKREIDYTSCQISIYHQTYSQNKITISCIIDGHKYENANLDDLVRLGIINVNYYLLNRKNLTGEEYENYEYKENEQVYIIPTNRVKLNEDSVEIIVPLKIELPPVYSKAIFKKNTKVKKITYN